MAKAASYASGYNEYRVNYRLTKKEAIAQDIAQASYEKAFASGRVGYHAPRDNSAYARGKRERVKAATEAKRDEAERLYGTRDLRRVPRAGGGLRERKQQAGKTRRESYARAVREAKQSRARLARVRG